MKITRDDLRQLIMEELNKLTEAVGPWPPDALSADNVMMHYMGMEPGDPRPTDDFVSVIPSEKLRPYLYKLTDRVDAIEQALGGKLSAEELPDVNLKQVSPEDIEVD